MNQPCHNTRNEISAARITTIRAPHRINQSLLLAGICFGSRVIRSNCLLRQVMHDREFFVCSITNCTCAIEQNQKTTQEISGCSYAMITDYVRPSFSMKNALHLLTAWSSWVTTPLAKGPCQFSLAEIEKCNYFGIILVAKKIFHQDLNCLQLNLP